MKKSKRGTDEKTQTSYPCRKMKISKGGTEKNPKKHHALCENEKNQKGGRTKKNIIMSLYENLKRGDRKRIKKQKNIMSLCENEKNQKGGRKKPILSLYENENLKKGDRKRIKKTQKTSCPYAKMKKIKKGDGRKKTSYPCMKTKISKRGTEKE
jgi:hypothetical protein